MPKKPDRPKETTIKLQYPIKIGSEEKTEIVLKRPKYKHMHGFIMQTEMPASMLMDIASKCSGTAPSAMDEIDGSDVLSICAAVMSFLGDGQETAKNA